MIKVLWRCSEGTLPPEFTYMFLYLCFCFLIIGLRTVCFNRTWSCSLTTQWKGEAVCGSCFSCYSHLHCHRERGPLLLMLSCSLWSYPCGTTCQVLSTVLYMTTQNVQRGMTWIMMCLEQGFSALGLNMFWAR